MEPNRLDSVIKKIQALRALAGSTTSNAERETACELAAELVARFQIEEAQIAAASGKQEADDLEGKIIYETGRASNWKEALAFGLAELNNTFCLKFHGIRTDAGHRRGSRFRVFGRSTDIDLTTYMFDALEQMISDMVVKMYPTGNKRGVNPERESWCLGCVRGYLAKMRVARGGVLAQAPASVAMVLVGRVKQIEDAWKAASPNNKLRAGAGSKATMVNSAFTSGFERGQKLNVTPGLGGSKPAPRLS